MISQSTLAIAIVVAFVIGAVLIFRTVQDMRLALKSVKRALTADEHDVMDSALRSSVKLVARGVAEPTREPLSDEQIAEITKKAARRSALRHDRSTSARIARAVERAHGIGGSDE